jgi:hypothetical protein
VASCPHHEEPTEDGARDRSEDIATNLDPELTLTRAINGSDRKIYLRFNLAKSVGQRVLEMSALKSRVGLPALLEIGAIRREILAQLLPERGGNGRLELPAARDQVSPRVPCDPSTGAILSPKCESHGELKCSAAPASARRGVASEARQPSVKLDRALVERRSDARRRYRL